MTDDNIINSFQKLFKKILGENLKTKKEIMTDDNILNSFHKLLKKIEVKT